MRRIIHCASMVALTATCNAFLAHRVTAGEVAVGGIGQVAIIDRSSGVELVPHFYRGEYWVAGTPGAAYSIAIRNRLSERLLAVTSVDGINVVSGATAAWDQTGYVFGPNQRYEINGWRKSDSEVAAFTFTESSNSYAERTGRPANVGVIGVALFRERQPEPVYAPPVVDQSLDEAQATPEGTPGLPSAAASSPAPARSRTPAAEGATSPAPAPSGALQSPMRSYAPPIQ